MAIQKWRPTTPGRRGGSVLDFSDLTDKPPEKSLLTFIKKSGGRNHHGEITSRRRGGGAKRMYRIIDFKRAKDGIPAKVAAIEYDPNRSCRIALLHYADGEKRYIIAPEGLVVGMSVESGAKVEPKVGNAMPMSGIPTGLTIHNVELHAGRGGVMGRSAGTEITLAAKDGIWAILILPSGEQRKVHLVCRATIGSVGNGDHHLVTMGKAGRNRHKGRRPKVRGVAQNPVGHPMGGGEGRSSGGQHPCSPWGKLAKGGKTRNPRKTSSNFIVRRRKKR